MVIKFSLRLSTSGSMTSNSLHGLMVVLVSVKKKKEYEDDITK